jgi:hypothetical protein
VDQQEGLLVQPPLGIATNVEVIYLHGGQNSPPPIVVLHTIAFKKRAEAFSIVCPKPFIDMKMKAHLQIGIGLALDDASLGGTNSALRNIAKGARRVAEQFRDAGL